MCRRRGRRRCCRRPRPTWSLPRKRRSDAVATPVVLIPGDGIGPEVTAAMKRVLEAAGADVAWVEADAGLGAAERFGNPLPSATLDQVRRYRVALKGPCTTPVGKGFRSINVQLR